MKNNDNNIKITTKIKITLLITIKIKITLLITITIKIKTKP